MMDKEKSEDLSGNYEKQDRTIKREQREQGKRIGQDTIREKKSGRYV